MGRIVFLDVVDDGAKIQVVAQRNEVGDMQWAMLTDRTQVFSAHTGIAYRVTPWLSLGVGLRRAGPLLSTLRVLHRTLLRSSAELAVVAGRPGQM